MLFQNSDTFHKEFVQSLTSIFITYSSTHSFKVDVYEKSTKRLTNLTIKNYVGDGLTTSHVCRFPRGFRWTITMSGDNLRFLLPPLRGHSREYVKAPHNMPSSTRFSEAIKRWLFPHGFWYISWVRPSEARMYALRPLSWWVRMM
jgi:hypothetical protein